MQRFNRTYSLLALGVLIVARLAFSAVDNTTAAPSVQSNVPKHFTFGHPGRLKDVTRVIKIRAVDDHFEPSHLTVLAGTTVKFIVTDMGKLPHEFVLGDTDEQEEHEREMQSMGNMEMSDDANGISLVPGQTKSLLWTFAQDGIVLYACHSRGHFEAGMIGVIIVRTAAPKAHP